MDIVSSVVGSIISKIAESLVEPTIRQFRYMFCSNDFVQEFNERKQNLTLALDRLQNAVNVAKRNAEEIEKDVNKWLEDANKETEDVKHFEDEIGKNGECFTWCPNWRRGYKLSKALAEKNETFSKLEEKGKIFLTVPVSHKAPLQDIEFLPSKDFTPSESSKEAFNQIMEALKDDNVNMIGLYGMGGVGKTTLVKEVGRRAKELQLFDRVLMAVVSQNPNVTNTQDQMADSLVLRFDESSIKGRADRLWQRLQNEKTMLIILDDVWKDIDLREIGIPFGDAHSGCKILLTTRLENICSSMECQRKVFLSVLSEKEAWALFKRNAGLRDEGSALNEVAKKVARECNGLPIALVTVGSALREASKVQWEVAYERLKKSQFLLMEQINEQKNAFACLKLSYDYLKHKETKLCFLLCCLFPEDHNIPIEDLTRYAVGYGLHQDAESIEDARKQVYVAVENLKACCMLLGPESGQHVKMHDLVRDVAIQIASSKEFDFVVKAGIGLKEWPGSFESFEGCTVISLMGNRLTELHDGLVCPRLKVLLLELVRDLNVPYKFFEGMKAIEVLSMKGGSLSLESLECSTHLQSLEFIDCECKDLISLRTLQRLKILGFLICSSIEKLPAEIGELKNLRLLELRGCYRLGRIPVNLIGRLKKLEELSILDNSFTEWGVGGTSTGGMNASLTEINSLSHLAALSLWIPETKYIPRDFVFSKLLKYEILIGRKSGWRRLTPRSGYPTARRLTFANISATSLNAKTFEQLFPSVSLLELTEVEGLKNIIWSHDQMTTPEQQRGFLQGLEFVEMTGCKDICTVFPAKFWRALENLRSVIISFCFGLEEVFELGEVDQVSDEEKVLLLSSLTELKLESLPKLKCIWKEIIATHNDGAIFLGSEHLKSLCFPGLCEIEVSGCNKLKSLFPITAATGLPQLKSLKISWCDEWEEIIATHNDGATFLGSQHLKSLCFPSLCEIEVTKCNKLKSLLPNTAAAGLPQLKSLAISCCNELEEIIATHNDGAIFLGSEHLKSLCFPSLCEIEVSGCNKLKSLFPVTAAIGLPQLKSLKISWCDEWEEIIATYNDGATFLGSEHLKSLCFPSLCEIGVSRCNKLKSLFPVTAAAGLPQLKSLKISWCEELEEIIATYNDGAIFLGSEHHKSLCFPSLCKIKVSRCNKLKSLFPVTAAAGLPQLKSLEISWCEELEEIIATYNDGAIFLGSEHLKSLCFPSLCEIKVSGCNKLKSLFPITVASGLPQLKSLEISWCEELEEIIATHNDGAIFLGSEHLKSLCFPSLCEIKVSGCNKLKSLFPITAATGLPQLKSLEISLRKELEEIITTHNDGAIFLGSEQLKSLCFPSLCEIEVDECNKLKSLFPVTVAAGLPQLKSLKISWCEELEEIIATYNDGAIFLGSEHLKSLCFPSLCEIKVNGCNKLKSLFPITAAAGLPQLKSLEISWCKELEEVIATHYDGAIFLGSEHLKSSCFPNLCEIKVSGCNKLKSLFPITATAGLPQLKSLKIYWCDDWEEIIATHNDGAIVLGSEHLKSLCFPSLCEIEVTRCNKLKSLFPVTAATGLLQLKSLKVRDAPQLTEVFGQDGKASPVDVEKEIVVPNLQWLSLKNLPSIVCFSFGCKNFLFPSLERCIVGNCPRMAMKFTVTRNGSMSAQSEVSQVGEDSSNSCAMPRATDKMWTRDDGWREEENDGGDTESDDYSDE